MAPYPTPDHTGKIWQGWGGDGCLRPLGAPHVPGSGWASRPRPRHRNLPHRSVTERSAEALGLGPPRVLSISADAPPLLCRQDAEKKGRSAGGGPGGRRAMASEKSGRARRRILGPRSLSLSHRNAKGLVPRATARPETFQHLPALLIEMFSSPLTSSISPEPELPEGLSRLFTLRPCVLHSRSSGTGSA